MDDPGPAKKSPKNITNINQAVSSCCSSFHVVHVSCHQEDDVDGGSTVPKMSRIATAYAIIYKVCCFLLIMAAFVFGVACLSIFGLATSVILLISLLLVRILQLVKSGDDYAKLVRVKHFIRLGLFICALLIVIGFGIFYPVLKYVPSLKQIKLFEPDDAVIISIISGLYMFSSVLYCIVHTLLPRYIPHGFGLNARQASSEIIDCLFFLWASSISIKKDSLVEDDQKILGLHTRIWIDASIFVVVSYNLITLLNRLIVHFLQKICQPHDDKGKWQLCLRNYFNVRYVVYYAKGMMASINFMMSSLLLLLTWIWFFGLHNGMETLTQWKFGMWTFVSLFICSFLWLIKTFLLLTWEAHTIYHRLEHRIVSTRVKAYFLGRLGSITCDGGVGEEQGGGGCLIQAINTLKRFFTYEKRSLEDILLVKKLAGLNMDAIQQVSQYFLEAKQDLSKETYLSDLQQKFESRCRRIRDGSSLEPKIQDDGSTRPVENFIRKEVEETEHVSSSDRKRRDYLTPFLKKLHDPQNVAKLHFPYNKVRTWVERAHNQCVNLANTISSAKEVANCLDNMISWLLIGAIFIMWLLLTGLASTQVLVLIASPLLAASFMFKGCCKTLFQGIIYVFVVHPIDVGDLCVIDDKMMEVRSIGVWTTTFVKVDKFATTQELVIYPNSQLTKKAVVNHKTMFDWSDRAQFNLGSSKMTKGNIKHQEAMSFFTNRLLPDDGEEEEERSEVDEEDEENHLKSDGKQEDRSKHVKIRTLNVSAKEDNITLIIRLEYKAGNIKDWTYSECLQRKDELKDDFHLYMQDIISEFKAEQAKNEVSQLEIKESSLEDVSKRAMSSSIIDNSEQLIGIMGDVEEENESPNNEQNDQEQEEIPEKNNEASRASKGKKKKSSKAPIGTSDIMDDFEEDNESPNNEQNDQEQEEILEKNNEASWASKGKKKKSSKAPIFTSDIMDDDEEDNESPNNEQNDQEQEEILEKNNEASRASKGKKKKSSKAPIFTSDIMDDFEEDNESPNKEQNDQEQEEILEKNNEASRASKGKKKKSSKAHICTSDIMDDFEEDNESPNNEQNDQEQEEIRQKNNEASRASKGKKKKSSKAPIYTSDIMDYVGEDNESPNDEQKDQEQEDIPEKNNEASPA